MDLRLYGGVLRRFWPILMLGIMLAGALAVLSYYNVRLVDGRPELTPRAKEVWTSSATLFLTEPGFPAGRRRIELVPVRIGNETVLQSAQNNPEAYTSLASLYARLAQSDEVAQLIEQDGRGPLTGTFSAIPTADTTYRRAEPLPMLSLFGTANTAEDAQLTAERGKNAFLSYLETQQDEANIRTNKRVVVETLNEPQTAQLVTPRKKTLPFVVFLAVLFATIALLFVLENMRPRNRPAATEPSLVDVRRSA